MSPETLRRLVVHTVMCRFLEIFLVALRVSRPQALQTIGSRYCLGLLFCLLQHSGNCLQLSYMICASHACMIEFPVSEAVLSRKLSWRVQVLWH